MHEEMGGRFRLVFYPTMTIAFVEIRQMYVEITTAQRPNIQEGIKIMTEGQKEREREKINERMDAETDPRQKSPKPQTTQAMGFLVPWFQVVQISTILAGEWMEPGWLEWPRLRASFAHGISIESNSVGHCSTLVGGQATPCKPADSVLWPILALFGNACIHHTWGQNGQRTHLARTLVQAGQDVQQISSQHYIVQYMVHSILHTLRIQNAYLCSLFCVTDDPRHSSI